MTFNGWLQIAVYVLLILAVTKPLGIYMARVFAGERTFLTPVLARVERGFYALAGVDARREQHWTTYSFALLLFSIVSFLAVYGLQRLQGVIPYLNPQAMQAVSEHLAFNTAVSFMTNTNWQSYGGESTLGYLVQMAALTVQNFVSAAAGIAIAIALTRGFARASASTIGNFWVDLTRATLYIMLPMSIVVALVLVALGVPQNLHAYTEATTLEGAKQIIAQGPVASQLAIKQLGTNGGGFWNANSAVPYENPTPISNFVEAIYILLIAAALTHTFGRMVRDARQGWAIYAAMSIIFFSFSGGIDSSYFRESIRSPKNLMICAGVSADLSSDKAKPSSLRRRTANCDRCVTCWSSSLNRKSSRYDVTAIPMRLQNLITGRKVLVKSHGAMLSPKGSTLYRYTRRLHRKHRYFLDAG